MVTIQPTNEVAILDRIKRGEPFSTSRFGDGEWNAVLQQRKTTEYNCDGHRYFPEMGNQLGRVLQERPPYLLGMQNFALRLLGDRIERWLSINASDLTWYDADVLAMHRASGQGRIQSVFEAFRSQALLMVGPAHLGNFARTILKARYFIAVPARDVFLKLAVIEDLVRHHYSHAPKPLVISISCGMPAGLLVDRLYPDLGHDAFLLDMGSVWDVYAGVRSRKYMWNIKVPYEPVADVAGSGVANGPTPGSSVV